MSAEDAFQPRLRDTLYLDTARIRSLLAQLRGGVVEGVVERWGKRDERRLGARLLGIEAGGHLLDEATVEQTTTLQDALFNIFEEAADESSLFRDADLADPESWRNGSLQDSLRPGQLIRVTAPTQIIDAEHVAGELTRALEAMEAFAFFQEAEDPTPLPQEKPVPPQVRQKHKQKLDPEEWRQAAVTARAEATLGTSIDSAVAIRVMFEKIIGPGISVRVFPCGPDHLDLTLAGRLASREGYLRDEHATLFAKYGWGSSDWTVVAQLATVPSKPAEEDVQALTDDGVHSDDDDDDDEPAVVASEEGLNRAEFEALGIDMMKTFAEAGMMGAPLFPGITITPIAIYRDVPSDPQETDATSSVYG